MRKVDVSWNVRFEVTFYGVDKEGKSFREIKENTMKFDDKFEIPNKLPFDSKENVEINFLLWVDGISPKKLVPLPYDCLLYTSPSPRDQLTSRMPSSA